MPLSRLCFSRVLDHTMKYSRDDIVDALRLASVPTATAAAVIEDLDHRAEQEAAQATTPQEKWDTVILLNADQVSTEAGYGWVVKIPEGTSAVDIVQRLQQSGGAFNMTRKGRRTPVTNIAEALENSRPGITTDLYRVKVVTKTQVVVVPVPGGTAVSRPSVGM